MADNGEYARYQYRLQQAQIAKDAAARAAARDTGTNSPVRTFAQTQSTSNYETGFEGSVKQAPVDDATGGAGQVAIAPTSAGVGATDDGTAMGDTTPNPDESYGGATQDEQDAINKAQQGVVSGAAGTNTRRQIIPQGNILDRFASYTYRASVYLMSPEQYQQLVRSKKKSINGYNLLFQSGGAPKNVGGLGAPATQTFFENDGTSSTTGYDAGRNPSFPLDFYIDSLTIKHITQGQGTGAAHAVTTMNFTVIEPMGITLIDRLYAAVQDHAPKEEGTGKINYSTAQYLMVLRWYGYDINGNLIKGGPTLSDPNAVIEKFIPFAINSIQWSVNNKLVTYDFSCTAQGQYVGGGTRRGTVPYDIQLSGSTVSEILGGGAILPQASTAATPGATTTSVSSAQAERDDAAAVDATGDPASPPPKANAAKNPSSKSNIGLMGIMNDHVYQLTTGARPIYQYPDEYEIVFIGAAKQLIGDATVVLPGSKKEANQTPMGPSQTKDTSGASPATDQKNTTMKTIPAVAGQPIVQVIDRVIRNSSYITGQQLTQINPDTNDEEPNPAAANKPVNWYSINFEAVPLKPDNLRNDYSYKIRYIISVYKIDKYDSKYFPIGNFRGVHKSYPWWFTGKNTAVLEYNEALNTSYNMLVSGSNTLDSGTEIIRRQYAATLEDMVIYTYGPTSSESMQGSKERGNEASANIADSLYGGADLANANLKIIGDPAWIQQGSISGGITAAELDFGSFLPDGTINFDAEQTYFEVRWNRPDDYDLSTGMAVPTSKTNKTKSRVFMATEISSEFKQGKFEQTIVGTLFNIPKPDGSNKAPDASLPVPIYERDERGRATTNFDSRVAAMQSTMPIEPQVNANPSNNSSQNSNVPALNVVSRNDGVPQPAPAPQPATSGSGENLDVGDPFVPPGALSGRITADGLDNSPSTPQIISRDY